MPDDCSVNQTVQTLTTTINGISVFTCVLFLSIKMRQHGDLKHIYLESSFPLNIIAGGLLFASGNAAFVNFPENMMTVYAVLAFFFNGAILAGAFVQYKQLDENGSLGLKVLCEIQVRKWWVSLSMPFLHGIFLYSCFVPGCNLTAFGWCSELWIPHNLSHHACGHCRIKIH